MFLLCTTTLCAQPRDDKWRDEKVPDEQGLADESDPLLSNWKWAAEVRWPDKAEERFVAIPVPASLFAKAASDLRDVRLADAHGKRVPYVLRVLRDERQQMDIAIMRQFNAGPTADKKTFEMSVELADVPAPGHNEIEIETTGRDFRRKVEVLGADSDKFAKPQQLLEANAFVLRFDLEGRIVEKRRFGYDFKQFRFLKVRVHADPGEQETPKITRVTVRRSIVQTGEYAEQHAQLEERQATRGQGGPASAWYIRLLNRMPVEKLVLEMHGEPGQRPLEVQHADPGQPRYSLLVRDWSWRRVKPDAKPIFDEKNGAKKEKPLEPPLIEDKMPVRRAEPLTLEIVLNEVVAERLRLVVTDFANVPFDFHSVKAVRAERLLIVEKLDPKQYALPIKMYVGNDLVGPPHYDLAAKVPPLVKPASRGFVSDFAENPNYAPPKTPLHEQMPWLVYLVLGIACTVLLAILALLARHAIARHDAEPAEQIPA